MIKGIAFVGLALAGMAASAAAASSKFDSDRAGVQPVQDVAPNADMATTSGMAAVDGADAAPVTRPHAARPARPRLVRVLPPLRPSFDAAPAADGLMAGSGEIAVTVPDVPAFSPGVVATSDVPTEAAPAVEQPSAERPHGRVVSVLPPLRPAFEASEPAVETNVAGPAAAEPASAEIVVLQPAARLVAMLPPARPAFRSDPQEVEIVATEPAPGPEPVRSLFGSLFNAPLAAASAIGPAVVGAGRSVMGAGHSALDSLIAAHARANDVPADLVHRVVIRESKYNPRAVGYGGALGLMQIKHATARALGYTGPASGLLDADTNLTYAVKYLAGAYRTANDNYDQAVRYYARGYYYAAKARSVRYASGRRLRNERREADASGTDDAAQ